ncbi:MAG: GNAT family protein [Trueperaceae bacterium]
MRLQQPVLSGNSILLSPLLPDHIAPLMNIARESPEIFVWTSTPRSDEERDHYFGQAFAQRDSGVALPFAIVRKESGAVAGTSRLNELDLPNRRCSIGYSWIAPCHHGDGTNLESKYLLLEYAFEELSVNRVQFQVDERNTASRRALEKLGATQEGRLRLHMLAKDGTYRNTVIYSIVAAEWSEIKPRLVERMRGKVRAGE